MDENNPMRENPNAKIIILYGATVHCKWQEEPVTGEDGLNANYRSSNTK
jgi:hypothetical protein